MLLLAHSRCFLILPRELCPLRRFYTMGRHNKAANKAKSSAPKKSPLTHFLCIPLVNSTSQPQLEISIGKFEENVCSGTPVQSSQEVESAAKSNVFTLSPEAVRPLGSLHLTLGVMSLDEDKLAQANTLLQSLDLENMLQEATSHQASQLNPIDASTTAPDSALSTPLAKDQAAATAIVPTLESSPLTLSLESLEPMQSPTKTSILYISPHDATNRLQPLCQALRRTFMEAGLLVPDTRPLKLHATIVNTIYIKGRKKNKKSKAEATKEQEGEAKGTETNLLPSAKTPEDKDGGIQANAPDSGHGPSARSSLYLDATSLLSTYGSYIWASDIPISKIAICEMGVKKQLSSTGEVVGGAYKEVATRAI
jgi:activating signal cointegrator complex subunit 1